MEEIHENIYRVKKMNTTEIQSWFKVWKDTYEGGPITEGADTMNWQVMTSHNVTSWTSNTTDIKLYLDTINYQSNGSSLRVEVNLNATTHQGTLRYNPLGTFNLSSYNLMNFWFMTNDTKEVWFGVILGEGNTYGDGEEWIFYFPVKANIWTLITLSFDDLKNAGAGNNNLDLSDIDYIRWYIGTFPDNIGNYTFWVDKVWFEYA
jgi:hypothetical protein